MFLVFQSKSNKVHYGHNYTYVIMNLYIYITMNLCNYVIMNLCNHVIRLKMIYHFTSYLLNFLFCIYIFHLAK